MRLKDDNLRVLLPDAAAPLMHTTSEAQCAVRGTCNPTQGGSYENGVVSSRDIARSVAQTRFQGRLGSALGGRGGRQANGACQVGSAAGADFGCTASLFCSGWRRDTFLVNG